MSPGQSSRSPRKGLMAPPPPVTASATQSLFSSILAPPPAKRARTIHNPHDPPLPASGRERPATPPPRKSSKVTRTPDSQGSKTRTRKTTKEKSAAGSSGKGKGKQRSTGGHDGGSGSVDIDLKAAATLTSLLMSSRHSMSGVSVGSPRSSISAGSDSGSGTHPLSQYGQSSTRPATSASSRSKPRISAEGSFTLDVPAAHTPPPSSPGQSQYAPRRHSVSQTSSLRVEGSATPKTHPHDRTENMGTPDAEAANLMLFLATSPSPSRPTTTRDKDARDAVAFRALSGNSLKGRVLFPTVNGKEAAPHSLRRDGSSNFSSFSSVTTEPLGEPGSPRRHAPYLSPLTRSRAISPGAHHLDVPMEPTIIPPTPTDLSPQQLFPRLPSPRQSLDRPSSIPPGFPGGRLLPSQEVARAYSDGPTPSHTPHTPLNYHFSDMVNVSPSPATGTGALGPHPRTHLPPQLGRRLFDGHAGVNGASDGSLGSGIDVGQA